MRRRLFFVLAAAVMLFIIPHQAKADIVYSNLGPGNSYNATAGWSLGNVQATDYEHGDAFTPSANYELTSIELAVGLGTGSNSLNVLLMTSDHSGSPSTVLESFSFNGQMRPFGSINPLLSANSLPNIDLISGDQYWLIAAVPDPSGSSAWNWNNIGANGNHTESIDNGSTWFVFTGNAQGAFQINGDPLSGGNSAVPEPASLLLLATGLAGIFLLRNILQRK